MFARKLAMLFLGTVLGKSREDGKGTSPMQI
jgi:hypothetical protein